MLLMLDKDVEITMNESKKVFSMALLITLCIMLRQYWAGLSNDLVHLLNRVSSNLY